MFKIGDRVKCIDHFVHEGAIGVIEGVDDSDDELCLYLRWIKHHESRWLGLSSVLYPHRFVLETPKSVPDKIREMSERFNRRIEHKVAI